MKLFNWSSEALRQYGSGSIIAMGATVEEARAAVRAAAPSGWLRKKCYFDEGEAHWLLHMTNEDDIEEYRKWLAKIDTDIAKEPSIDSVVFISGSD